MNIDFTPGERKFQEEVRQWFAENLPEEIKQKVELGLELSKDEQVAWERKLGEKGWLAANWPEEFGGPGWTATERYIFAQERALASAPNVSPFGVAMVAPVIMAFGTDEQKEEYLPKIRTGRQLWCQGYSEPGAGSDLASLKTAAKRKGDHYVVNGQKIWTTQAHWADMMFCLVRTSSEGRKQQGISFLLIDMNSPGIEVRPIITIDGVHHLNEVFLTDVKVPVNNRVGEEGQGWTLAKYLLGHERTGIAGVPESTKQIARLKRIAGQDTVNGAPLLEDPDVRRRIAELEIDLKALEYTNFRTLDAMARGNPPGPESSGLKIKGTQLQQGITEALLEMGGYLSLPWHTEEAIGMREYNTSTLRYNFLRASTIYGGSNEIQKNVIAKNILGLG
ncbi:MAG TPA: acyl-CoA dehydrogenase family protein [Gammaproteobacteria bacterium]|nr:acyl-CoA dehydrogenase family protein [Gammaproteobacteria bacterium]